MIWDLIDRLAHVTRRAAAVCWILYGLRFIRNGFGVKHGIRVCFNSSCCWCGKIILFGACKITILQHGVRSLHHQQYFESSDNLDSRWGPCSRFQSFNSNYYSLYLVTIITWTKQNACQNNGCIRANLNIYFYLITILCISGLTVCYMY